MRKRSDLSAILLATLLTGCAAHTPSRPLDGPAPAADDTAGAVAANLFYVPGRALVCGGGALLAGVTMLLTLGQDYDGASQLMHGGCSGPWTVTSRDIRQAVP